MRFFGVAVAPRWLVRPISVLIRRRLSSILLAVFLLASLSLPSRATAMVSRSGPTPAAYLTAALTWLQDYDVRSKDVQWPAIRRQAAALAQGARTVAGTYPAIRYAVEQLGDTLAGFSPANRPMLDSGYDALWPDGLVAYLEPGGPAARAGLRLGDRIQLLNGGRLRQWFLNGWVDQGTARHQVLVVRRSGHPLLTLAITVRPDWVPSPAVRGRRMGTIGYLQIPSNGGVAGYATQAQRVMRRIDSTPTCGWIIDLRQTWSGDIWSYLAAVGPILGNGNLGGFVYPNGRKEPWAYFDGQVLWNFAERYEDQVVGPVYAVRQRNPPVALLLDQTTSAAGELVAVAFAGRLGVRTFGQPTWGTPSVLVGTTLSDGTELVAAGSNAYDRTGQIYQGPIIPDVRVSTDWAHFGTNQDPVVQAASAWLESQPGCASKG